MKNFILFVGLITIFSCQKKSEIKNVTWSEGQPQSQLALIQAITTSDHERSVFYKDQKITFNSQAIGENEIAETFVKKIFNTQKKIQQAQARYVDVGFFDKKTFSFKSHDSEKMIQDLKSQTGINHFRRYEMKPFIKHLNDSLSNWTAIEYELFDGTLWIAEYDQFQNLISNRRLGSQFDTAQALLYKQGPKLGSLTDVLLEQISLSPSVNNASIFVDSESDKKIASVTPLLKFDPKDERFDQIQVFYYLDQVQNWMKNHLQVRFPQKLTAVVNVGYPEKTNTAFYYQNKIRLGHGDDVTYTALASDPSIVYHESFHALVDGLAHLPFEKEGGSLNEAFADFFTCVALNRPFLGESSYLKGPYKRTVQNNKKLDEKNGGLYGDSLIVSGLLWDIKEKIGAEKSLNLATETLLQLNPYSEFKEFNLALIKASAQLSSEDRSVVQNILKQRGFIHE